MGYDSELGTWNLLNHGRFSPDKSSGGQHVLSGELGIEIGQRMNPPLEKGVRGLFLMSLGHLLFLSYY